MKADKGWTGPKLTPAQREEVVAAYLGGERVKSLALRYGISSPAVSSLLKNRSIVRHVDTPVQDCRYVNSREAAEILGVSVFMALLLARSGSLTNQVTSPENRMWNEPYVFLRSEVERVRDTRPRRLRLPPRPDLPDTDFAYMAGLLDGEGSICIHGPVADRGLSFGLLILVTNTHRGVMDWCLENFGGAINVRHHKEAHHRTIYVWKTTGPRATEVVRHILPWLKIKREQALLGIEFQAHLEAYRGHRHKPIDEAERAWRREMQRRVQRLNKGIEPSP